MNANASRSIDLWAFVCTKGTQALPSQRFRRFFPAPDSRSRRSRATGPPSGVTPHYFRAVIKLFRNEIISSDSLFRRHEAGRRRRPALDIFLAIIFVVLAVLRRARARAWRARDNFSASEWRQWQRVVAVAAVAAVAVACGM